MSKSITFEVGDGAGSLTLRPMDAAEVKAANPQRAEIETLQSAILETVAETPGILKGALEVAVREQLGTLGHDRFERERDYLIGAGGRLQAVPGPRGCEHYIPEAEAADPLPIN